jgi:hypothetical protein
LQSPRSDLDRNGILHDALFFSTLLPCGAIPASLPISLVPAMEHGTGAIAYNNSKPHAERVFRVERSTVYESTSGRIEHLATDARRAFVKTSDATI